MQCCSTAQPRLTLGAQRSGNRLLAFKDCRSSSSSRRSSSAGVVGRHAAALPQQKSRGPISRQLSVTCRAADDRPPAGSSSSSSGVAVKFNPVYLVITGAYAALLVFRNPYIYAVLTVLTILPQNSNVTSLNNLVLLFYESGLFQNFAEAVNCVRLVTWLSMAFMVGSFALFK